MAQQTQAKITFDCLQFKQQTQERIYRDIQNLEPDAEIEYFKQRTQHSPLGQWWNSIATAPTPNPSEPAS